MVRQCMFWCLSPFRHLLLRDKGVTQAATAAAVLSVRLAAHLQLSDVVQVMNAYIACIAMLRLHGWVLVTLLSPFAV
jgi:hypothetical protein